MKPKRQEDSSCVFAYYFVAALAIAAIPQEKKKAPKLLRRRSGRSFVKAVGTIRQENRQGRGKLPPCMPQSECGAGHTGYRASLRSVAGRITGHRRSLPQPSSAAGCPPPLHRSRAFCPMWQRTDLVQVKRDRHTGKPQKPRNTKAFRLRQSTLSAEIRRKRLSLPTGEVRPSEHNYDYKEIF